MEDVAPRGYTSDGATARQKETGHLFKFELTENERQAVDDYLKDSGKQPGEYLLTGRRGPGMNLTTRQYARLVSG